MNSILYFIETYESDSLYINFIHEEGHKTFIKKKYDKLFENISLDSDNYKSIIDLRSYLLNNTIFKYYDDNKNEKKIKINKKEVKFIKNEEIDKICGTLNNIDKRLLFNSFNENNNFFKKPKYSKFFDKIEYDKNNTQQRNKIFKDYIDNYFNII